MAVAEAEFPIGFTDRRKVVGDLGGTGGAQSAAGSTNQYLGVSVASLRGYLAGVNAGYFTTARLNTMTKNDMLYAMRQFNDAAGI